MMVDSGAYMMAINETIQAQVELTFIEKRKAIMTDGYVQEYDAVGPIHVKFKNRTAYAVLWFCKVIMSRY